jgi:hypothetical protein
MAQPSAIDGEAYRASLAVMQAQLERMIDLSVLIPRVNGIERMDEVKAHLLETRDLLELLNSISPDELLLRAVQHMQEFLTAGERTLTKASKSKVLSNALFKKRVKDLIYALSLENQKLVRRCRSQLFHLPRDTELSSEFVDCWANKQGQRTK